MPEGPELEHEFDRLHESIQEAAEEGKEGGGFFRSISLSTALIAVVAALASLEAGSTINEALLKKNASIASSTEAFDGWAQYQAKGIKAAVLSAQKQILISMDRVPQTSLDADLARYQKEQGEISAANKKLEKLSRDQEDEAERLIHRHHRYAASVALLQIAVALSAIAALARNRWMWLLSLGIATAGAAVFLDGFLLTF
jgi:sensor domain CHASE-containing protein